MISVIVPVYNVEKYLKRCVQSIIQQTYGELEIILVDDGSTDSSAELCEKLKSRDERIVVIHKKNGGLSSARNAGLDIAHGEYIGFVDSDDWIEPDMYESLLRSIEQMHADVAVTGICRIYEDGKKFEVFTRAETEFYEGTAQIVKCYLQQNSFSTAACDKLFRSELFEQRRFPVGKLYEDAPVIYDILSHIDRLVNLGKPHYYYFQRSTSICGQAFSKKKMDHFHFSEAIYENAKRNFPSLKKEAELFWGCKLNELIYTLAESSNRKEFQEECNILRKAFGSVATKVITGKTVYPIIKIKALLAALHLERVYVYLKSEMMHKG